MDRSNRIIIHKDGKRLKDGKRDIIVPIFLIKEVFLASYMYIKINNFRLKCFQFPV